MSRIDSIIVRARDKLVDTEKQRWSDARLLRLADEAQKDIARHSKLLKATYSFSLEIGEAHYDLPEDLWLITRATFNDCEIPLLSYDQLDEQALKVDHICWDTVTSSNIECLVYDNRDLQTIRVYPIPDDSIAENDYTFQNAGYLDAIIYSGTPFGVLTGVPDIDQLVEELGVIVDAEALVYLVTDPTSCNGVTLIDDVVFNSPYGVLAEVQDNVRQVAFHGDELLGEVVGIDDYTLDTVYGFTHALYDPAIAKEKFNSAFGVITSVDESSKVIKLWYVRLPKTIESAEDVLEIPSMFDTAMWLYVAGQAFLDDNDAAFQQKGQALLSQYDRELILAQTTERLDGTRSPDTFRTSYRGPFE